jgi:hypothetical protein
MAGIFVPPNSPDGVASPHDVVIVLLIERWRARAIGALQGQPIVEWTRDAHECPQEWGHDVVRQTLETVFRHDKNFALHRREVQPLDIVALLLSATRRIKVYSAF